MPHPFPITPAGLEKLKAELKQLVSVERPRNIKDIEHAR
ncbi:MAG: transcription elongation factor GreA, partial [Nitrospirota bacterium]